MTIEVVLKYFFIISAFLGFSLLINRLFLKFSRNMGIRHIDESIVRWSTTSKPAFGGISFYIIFLLSLAIYPIFFSQYEVFFNLQLAGIVMAISLGFMMGLADDAYNTNPLLKFSTQFVCGTILILTGTYIETFSFAWINYTFTLLWVVGLMNSINMLDNMDAVASVACFFAILGLLMVILLGNATAGIYTFLLCGIAASIIGFLVFNWHPSKMYMGDTGSQFLGISLAAMSILFLWNFQPSQNENILLNFLLPALAFIVPISDTVTVFINRISKGKSPFVGGKDHTTHHLSYIGVKEKNVPFIICGISFVSLCGIALCLMGKNKSNLLIYIFVAYVILVFLTLFLISRHKTHKQKLLNEL